MLTNVTNNAIATTHSGPSSDGRFVLTCDQVAVQRGSYFEATKGGGNLYYLRIVLMGYPKQDQFTTGERNFTSKDVGSFEEPKGSGQRYERISLPQFSLVAVARYLP